MARDFFVIGEDGFEGGEVGFGEIGWTGSRVSGVGRSARGGRDACSRDERGSLEVFGFGYGLCEGEFGVLGEEAEKGLDGLCC